MSDAQILAPCVLKHAKARYNAVESSGSLDDFLKRLAESQKPVTGTGTNDLDHSIAQYYISSSHNTYLTGNQLWSRSSTDTYKEVLKQGCRCIEVDIWDGGSPDSSDVEEKPSSRRGSTDVRGFVKKQLVRLRSRSRSERPAVEAEIPEVPPTESLMPTPWRTNSNREEPRVLHGHTATKEVSFRKVCEIIREYAFYASDLPLIVSLEVHCSPSQQEVMVEIMRDYWQGYLVSPPADFGDTTQLPHLESLKKTILVKVKYSPPNSAKPRQKSPQKSPQSSPKKTPQKSTPKPNASAQDDLESSGEETPAEAVKKGHIIPELSRLGIWTRACHFRDLDQPEAKMPTHVFALSENKLLTMCEEKSDALFRHNLDYLMRAYPKGTRLRSSNLDPAPLWRFGIQMVALNMQTVNAATMLNHVRGYRQATPVVFSLKKMQAMFDGSGGWVLKPKGYRRINGEVAPVSKSTLDLTVELLACQGVASGNDTPDVYVKCELHVESKLEREQTQIPNGAKNKGGEFKYHSRVVHHREPDLAGEKVEFHGVRDIAPELSFVRYVTPVH